MYLFQLLVPRQSYLPLVTDKVQRHFLKYADPESHGEMWLEYNGQPLKWYVTLLLTHVWPNEKNTIMLNHKSLPKTVDNRQGSHLSGKSLINKGFSAKIKGEMFKSGNVFSKPFSNLFI